MKVSITAFVTMAVVVYATPTPDPLLKRQSECAPVNNKLT